MNRSSSSSSHDVARTVDCYRTFSAYSRIFAKTTFDLKWRSNWRIYRRARRDELASILLVRVPLAMLIVGASIGVSQALQQGLRSRVMLLIEGRVDIPEN